MACLFAAQRAGAAAAEILADTLPFIRAIRRQSACLFEVRPQTCPIGSQQILTTDHTDSTDGIPRQRAPLSVSSVQSVVKKYFPFRGWVKDLAYPNTTR
jgi:hypothetical protein